uniref:Uncharacterized protein n=1 Tax=Arundo donax TaxID=35708 RepID=A0A0A8ZVW2_ARUDO
MCNQTSWLAGYGQIKTIELRERIYRRSIINVHV